MKEYVPDALKLVMFVVGLVGETIVAVPGLPVCADHVPAPVPAMVAVPPGISVQRTD